MPLNEYVESQIANLPFLEKLFESAQSQDIEIDPSWTSFLNKLENNLSPTKPLHSIDSQSEKIYHLAEAYRRLGHRIANINPLDNSQKEYLPLAIENYGFKEEDKKQSFPTLGLLPGSEATLESIIDRLKKSYCQTIGFEFKEYTDPKVEEWIQHEIERGRFLAPFTKEEKLIILDSLTQSEILESFFHTKHVGKKRFSLEGAESLIPMLNILIAHASKMHVEEFFIGMSHRGRVNVLANILKKPLSKIFLDFDEEYIPDTSDGTGDIRYHKGFANDSAETYSGKIVKLTLAPNPSHLESIDPVIEGQTHAKQFLVNDEQERARVIPLLMHGDAALAGQGVVYETLQMGKLAGFETGGTIHVVINNQVGFTTSPADARSTLYCTDIARTFKAPVFHVNAEDPETCVRAILFAFDIRQKFHCDVFVDLNCYRKYGHNEGDEPAFTQPLEYQQIRKKKSIRTLYASQLMAENVISQDFADEQEKKIKNHLQNAFEKANAEIKKLSFPSNYEEKPMDLFESVETRVDLSLIQKVAQSFSVIPENFSLHPKLANLVREREKAILEGKALDWGIAEFLAYGTLVWEGAPVRLCGQDSGRGTFSHRHALWVNQNTGEEYFPLAHLHEKQGRFEIYNTCLSEVAALGFEYGYSIICKQGLNIWEAQFGDFANSAQVIIDQYIASGEQKWGQISNLVLFLPHGFEGQGPEHSSARFERFLHLSGHENMRVIYPTTPAQIFHALRRQVKQKVVKPLIVMTPKGLLRHPNCTSTIEDFTKGKFHFFLDDPKKSLHAKRIIICSGRIYYDLIAEREKRKIEGPVIIRIEQLYPLDLNEMQKILTSYKEMQECFWVQEEPENMGAWTFIFPQLSQILPKGISLYYIGRERSAAPATGFYSRHKQELNQILDQVFKNEK